MAHTSAWASPRRDRRRAESDLLRSPGISNDMEKGIRKGGRDELGTGGKPVQANQDSGQTRPHGGACALPNLRSHLDNDSGGAECKYWGPGMFSEGVTFAILQRHVFAAGHNLAPEGALRPPLGRNAMPTPDRSASTLTPIAPPTHTRPQARVRLGAWSVDVGRGQRGVQRGVRRDGGGRRRGRLRRGARGRQGPGWTRHSRPSS